MRLGVALLLLAFLGLALFRSAYGRFTLNRSEPLVDAGAGPVSAKPSRRVLLVVLDGARADVVPAVPALARLARDGAFAELEADLPTISAAQYVSLLAGATPQTSGRRSNDAVTAVGVESVADVVRRSGGSAAVFSDCVDWWPQLFPHAFDAAVASDRFDGALQLARSSHDLVLVHLCAFDDAGHALGAASPQYRIGAASQVELKVAALVSAWDGAVVVTSDHGHTDSGGHGGAEPEVSRTFAIASGPGVAPFGRAKGRAVDLAATVAALMGLPAPAGSEGVALLPLLELSDSERERIGAADALRAAALREKAERQRLLLEAEADVARALRGASAVAALLLVAALVRRTRRSALIGLLAGLVALSLACAGYFVVVGPVSPSAARKFGELVVSSAVLGLVAAVLVVVPVVLRRPRDEVPGTVLAAAASASPLVLWAYAMFGLTASRVSITSAWAIALPSLAWACWAGMLVVMLVLLLLGVPRRRG